MKSAISNCLTGIFSRDGREADHVLFRGMAITMQRASLLALLRRLRGAAQARGTWNSFNSITTCR